jgi:release factor glutamine methyltransferase
VSVARPSAAPVEASAIGAALAEAARRIPGDAPRLEAEVWLAHLLGRDRAWLLAHPEAPVPPAGLEAFWAGVARLAQGEPLAYLTGRREFFGLEFLVNPNVLVPRPETELLVETALAAAQRLYAAHEWRFTHSPLRIADIGSGSGCIVVALAVHLPTAVFLATDVSAQALAAAWQNAARHGVVERIDFRQGSLLEPLAAPVDILCANLPYIDTDELAGLAVARHEPALALDGGAGGLLWVRRLLAAAPRFVNPGGAALLEIGATQGAQARALAEAAFPGAAVSLRRDLAGLDRLLVIELPGGPPAAAPPPPDSQLFPIQY